MQMDRKYIYIFIKQHAPALQSGSIAVSEVYGAWLQLIENFPQYPEWLLEI